MRPDERRDINVEVGLWRNGEPQAELYIHHLSVRPGSSQEQVVYLPSIKSPGSRFAVRFVFSGEMVHDWLSGEMWLDDPSNTPISTPRPFLMFLGVSDLPMTTTFPSLRAHPLSHTGIWVVSTRLAMGHQRLKEVHFGVPKASEEA